MSCSHPVCYTWSLFLFPAPTPVPCSTRISRALCICLLNDTCRDHREFVQSATLKLQKLGADMHESRMWSQAQRKVARATTTQKCVRTNDIENVGVSGLPAWDA